MNVIATFVTFPSLDGRMTMLNMGQIREIIIEHKRHCIAIFSDNQQKEFRDDAAEDLIAVASQLMLNPSAENLTAREKPEQHRPNS